MTLRIRGIARRIDGADASRPLFARGTVEDDEGHVLTSVTAGGALDVETSDGKVRVEIATDTKVAPMSTDRAPWAEIEASLPGVFRDFGADAPGPHVVVVFRGVTIREGHRVTVEGDELEHMFEEHRQGPRDAPSLRLRALRAETIAIDDAVPGPTVAPAPKTQKPPVTKPETQPHAIVRLGVWTCAAASLALAALFRFGPVTLDGITWALTLFAIGAYLQWLEVAPRFVGIESLPFSLRSVVGIEVLFILLALPFAIGDVAGSSRADGRYPNMSIVVAGCNLVTLVLLAIRLRRKTLRLGTLLQSLVEARPFPNEAGLDGAWGSIVGTVRDPTPVAVASGKAAIAQVTRVDPRPGSDPDIVTQSLKTEGSFFVDTDGGPYEIEPQRAIWATTFPLSKHTTDRGGSELTEVVPVGARVLVAGRATRGGDRGIGRLRADGAESLLFFATEANTDPRTYCLALRRRLTNTSRTILVMAVLLALVTGAMTPFLPAPYFPASD